jgi:cytochrome c peroxidase
MWNIYANDDFPEPQGPMQALMCLAGSSCDPEQILPRTIARFKTPTIRDLGQSDPYLHSGEMKTIEDVLIF